MARNVDLPHPDGPDTDRYSPRSMSSVTSLSAQVSSSASPLKTLLIPSSRISGMSVPAFESSAGAVDVLFHQAIIVSTGVRLVSDTSDSGHGTEIVSPGSAGVWIGRRRACVSCSKLYPSDSSLGSLNARAKNDNPTGRLSPVNPAGTMRSGKPVRLAMSVAASPPAARADAALGPAVAVAAMSAVRRDAVG